jgi:phosphate transport system protein
MPRDSLVRQIHHLQDEVLLLGSMVEEAVLGSIAALKDRDIPRAQQIYRNDQLINDKRFAIENAVLIIIATQQPMARDLRFLTAVLEVITELERMGDYAKGIGKVVVKLEDFEIPIPIREISQMAEQGVSMLHRALSAFVTENPNLAATIPVEDQKVDDLYNQVYRTIVLNMIDNPNTIDHSNLLLWVVHNLERLADRVVNICERTVFIATGELIEIESPDDEDME